VLVNLLNPKLSIFFFAFLPQFARADEPDAPARLLGLSAAFMAMTLAVFVVYGVSAASIRDRVLVRPKALAWMGRGACSSPSRTSAAATSWTHEARPRRPSLLAARLSRTAPRLARFA
jgi:hypothetical protein